MREFFSRKGGEKAMEENVTLENEASEQEPAVPEVNEEVSAEESLEERLMSSEKARNDAEERAKMLEARLCCMEMGVASENAEDVIMLAERFGGKAEGIAAVLEKYPFFGAHGGFKAEPFGGERNAVTTGIHMEQKVSAPCSGVEAAFRKANPTVKF
jgi:hypothetical protein